MRIHRLLMLAFPIASGMEINLVLLVFLGLFVGLVSGFIGVGGGFLMGPALIILGFPANFAVGTSLAWITGSAVIGTLRHRQLGNIDMKLGMWMVLGTLCGVEAGVRILNIMKGRGLADHAVLTTSTTILLVIGIYTLRETRKRKALLDRMVRKKEKLPQAMRALSISKRLQTIRIPPMIHFAKSRLTISAWVIIGIGFFTGLLAGFIGVSGGFLMVPALVYLLGLPAFLAVGTDMFQVIFTAAFGCARHTMSSNVLIFIAVILVLSSPLGVQCGVFITRFVRGVAMRYVLAMSTLIGVLGSILKLLDITLELPTGWLRAGSLVTVFGGMALVVAMVIGLLIMAIRSRKDKSIPVWAISLIQHED